MWNPLIGLILSVLLVHNIPHVATRGGEDLKLSDKLQGGSNMTGIDLYVNKPHCAAAVRP